MKILYIANMRMPTEKAHGIQIMKMCEAFKKAGVEVELVVAKRFNSIKKNPFEYYGIKEKFPIKYLFCIDLIKGSLHQFIGPIASRLQIITFILSLKFILMFNKADIIYCRNENVLLALICKNNLVYEAHKTPKPKYLLLMRRVKKIISITKYIKDELIKSDIDSEKILVAPDAVDLKEFSININLSQCREILKLPNNKKIAMYVGHLYDWKGVYVMAESVAFLPDDYLLVFVGGTDFDLKKFRKFILEKGLQNILVLGHKSRDDIPKYLSAADALILPNSAKTKISKYYTSPMKMFEYLTARRPIVASNLPSIREILNDKNAVLVEPDNPESLARGIIEAVENKDLKKIENASKLAQEFTWDKRAEKILKFL